jgi:large subunit ribosomal protein L4e
MAARPQVTVYSSANGEAQGQSAMPGVFTAPIRTDVVHFVHTNMSKNRRQPYAVNESAGHQHSAESWGTGRAVSRIPRVSGGGNSRSGQGAFGNMCRKGRMFAPTKVWRHWNRRINKNQRRYATASALAASALPSLVEARGHRVSQLPQVPLVVDGAMESMTSTKSAVTLLKSVGAFEDCEKSAASRKVRPGHGKWRNRRHVQRRGPLVVYAKDNGVVKAFRNVPGVDTCSVNALNLLQLAPGGHVGRFIVWTQPAFEALDGLFGSDAKTADASMKKRRGGAYQMPRHKMTNADVARLINSDEVQAAVRPVKQGGVRRTMRKNPLNNLGALLRLNPYAKTFKRQEAVYAEKQAAKRAAKN